MSEAITRSVYVVWFTDLRTGNEHEFVASIRKGYTTLDDIPALIAANGKSEYTADQHVRNWERSDNPNDFRIEELRLLHQA